MKRVGKVLCIFMFMIGMCVNSVSANSSTTIFYMQQQVIKPGERLKIAGTREYSQGWPINPQSEIEHDWRISWSDNFSEGQRVRVVITDGPSGKVLASKSVTGRVAYLRIESYPTYLVNIWIYNESSGLYSISKACVQSTKESEKWIDQENPCNI